MNIREKLIGLVLMTLTPAIAIQAWNEYELRHAQQAELFATALRDAQFASGEINQIVASMKVLVQTVGFSDLVRDNEIEKCETFVTAIQRKTPHLSTIAVADIDGRAFCATAPTQNNSVLDRSYFKDALASKGVIVGEYTVGRLIPRPVLPVAAPFYDEAGQPAGVVVATLSLQWLANYFTERKFSTDTRTIVVTDRKGTILVRLPDQDRWVGQKLGNAYDRYVFAAAPGTAEIVGIDGVKRILGYVPVEQPPSGLYVGVALTRATAFAPIDAATQRATMLLAMGALLAGVGAYLFGRVFILNPIERLSEAAGLWSRGKFGATAKVEGNDEFAALARTANHMATQLHVMTDTLQARVEQEMAARLKSEETLRQTQKMEAVGQLTGGLAHDFNNMLAIILGGIEMAIRRLKRGDTDIVRYLDGALDGANRATALTRRLLAFARQTPLEPVVLDLNGSVRSMSELLHRALGERVALETVLGAGLWLVKIDPGQLESAVLNLAVNARDAMPDGGKLTIETSNASLDEDYAALQGDIKAGQYVLLAVTDTGTGMTADQISRAFEPFFTTKPPGQGTGLGLSQIYGFLKQSAGHVRIYSEPGHGTTIKMYFPRSTDGKPMAPSTSGEPALPLAREGETVLVVEDEAGVRRSSVQALMELGYKVLEASSAEAAMPVLRSAQHIDLMFTDVVMPGRTGRQLANDARSIRPDLKIIFTTGYTRNAIVHNGIVDPGVELLLKPFSMHQLARRVRSVLNRTL